jgi:adenosylcobinamide-GDP ribazoletransferase
MPAARPDGLGRMVAATVHPIAATIGTVVVLAYALLLAWPDRLDLVGAAAATSLAVLTSFLTTRRAYTALGGTTGDVLGAAVELALPVALVALAVTP